MRTSVAVSWSVALVGAVCAAAAVVLGTRFGISPLDNLNFLLLIVVGALLMNRRPRNLVGWFILLGGAGAVRTPRRSPTPVGLCRTPY